MKWPLRITLWVLAIVGGIIVYMQRANTSVVVAGPETQPTMSLNAIAEVPAFAFIDENRQPLTREDLKGKVWAGIFFWTSCPGICPAMSSRLQELQEAVNDPSVKLVSFSVDPLTDTPEVLKQYAEDRGAESGRWHFATTEDPAAMKSFAASLYLPYENPIEHSGRIFLVDASGTVRGYYLHSEDGDVAKLRQDIATLTATAAR